MTTPILAAVAVAAVFILLVLAVRWRTPRVLVYQGRVIEQSIGKDAPVSRLDLLRAVNAHGLVSLGEVEYAILEWNGGIRVISRQQAFSH